jgi:hypothetical protein
MFIQASFQSNRLWLLKSVKDNFKSQPKRVWKIFFLPPGKDSHLAFSLRLLSLSVYIVEQWMLLQNILSRWRSGSPNIQTKWRTTKCSLGATKHLEN